MWFLLMHFLVSPFPTSLNENNIDQLIDISLDGPKFLSEEQLKNIIYIYKNYAPCRIAVMFFVVIYLFFEPCSLTQIRKFFIDILLIFTDDFRLKHICFNLECNRMQIYPYEIKLCYAS